MKHMSLHDALLRHTIDIMLSLRRGEKKHTRAWKTATEAPKCNTHTHTRAPRYENTVNTDANSPSRAHGR